jgi:HEAT repeat protein
VEQEINQLREAQNRLLKNPNDVDSLALILDMLRHGSGVTRGNAAKILGELADQIGASIADKAVPALIHLLETGDGFDKDATSEALKHFGPSAKSAIPALRRNLKPGDSAAWNSAEALGAMGEAAREAVPDLVNVIMERQKEYLDNGPHICKFAAQALGKIGPAAKEAVPALETLLDHSNLYFRGHVAIAIISIDPANRKAFSSMEGLLKSSDVELRREIMWAIEDIGTRAAPLKSLIRQALEDRDESVRRAAARLLKSLGDKDSKN